MSTRTTPRRSLLLLLVLFSTVFGLAPSADAHTGPVVDYRDRGTAVADLQGHLGGLDQDGVFGKLTATRVIDFQNWKGLLPDAVVGPITWAHVNNPGLPNTTTSFAPKGAKRIVVDTKNNALFAINPSGSVANWGWTVDNDVATRTGTFRVSQKILINRNLENEQPGPLNLHHFVRFDGHNGFHAIPVNRDTGQPIHDVSQLGIGTRLQSLGCVRLHPAFAEWLYNWVPVGAEVTVVHGLKPGV